MYACRMSISNAESHNHLEELRDAAGLDVRDIFEDKLQAISNLEHREKEIHSSTPTTTTRQQVSQKKCSNHHRRTDDTDLHQGSTGVEQDMERKQ